MISTKNTNRPKPKIVQPGNICCTIHKLSLETTPYDKDALHVVVHVEGPDLGADFDGFFIDKDKPELGKYKGQTGKVKAGRYPFAKVTKTGAKRERDIDIGVYVKNLCNAMGYDGDIEGNTIEEFIENFNKLKPFEGKVMRMCICGREYSNKRGYPTFDLYFPYASKDGVPFELASIPEVNSKVYKFKEETHIQKKAKVETVESFGEEKPVTPITKDQFRLD